MASSHPSSGVPIGRKAACIKAYFSCIQSETDPGSCAENLWECLHGGGLDRAEQHSPEILVTFTRDEVRALAQVLTELARSSR